MLNARLPENAAAAINSTPLYVMKTDRDDTGAAAEIWLAVTTDQLFAVNREGGIIKRAACAEIGGARYVPAVAGGALFVELSTGPTVFARAGQECADRLRDFARQIDGVCSGEAEHNWADASQTRICPRCNRELADASRCAFCYGRLHALRRMLAYARPYRGLIAVAALLLLITTAVELVPPYVTKLLVDDVLQPQGSAALLLWLAAALLAARIGLLMMQAVQGWIGVWIGGKLMGDIRKDTYKSLLRLSIRFFDRRQSSQFISRVNHDAEAMRQFLADGVVWIAGQVMLVAAIFAMLLALNWRLAIIALVPVPLLATGSFWLWPVFRNMWYRQWMAVNKINMLVGDTLQGIRVVKAFGQEARENAKYRDANADLIRRTVQIDGLWQGVYPAFSFMTGLGAVAVLYVGGKGVLAGDMTLGTLIAFTAYLSMFFGPLQWFNQALSWTSRALQAADRLFEVHDAPREAADSTAGSFRDGNGGDCPAESAGKVEFRGVTFGYDRFRPVLQNIDLAAEPGELIGIVGHSGAGKSTLLNLLCRFYDPDSGAILANGKDIRSVELGAYRSRIGVVLQETFLFDGTVAENIAYAKPHASPEEILRAAAIANAHDFIVNLPDGYETRVGERGSNLSGGEKQRIAIARALLPDPPILLLDEATSAVDAKTEQLIQQALSRLVHGRTTFAIAHRLSTLINADRLIVLEHGRIVETGTHAQLMRRHGVYAKLVQSQMLLRDTAKAVSG